MKTKRNRSISIPITIVVPLALASCSDPGDLILNKAKDDAGASATGSGGGAAQGLGGSATITTSGGTAGTISSAGGGGSGAGGSADLGDAASTVQDAATPVPGKLGAVLFSADFEDGKIDGWTTYDGAMAISSVGANGSTKSLGFRTTAPGSIGKTVTAGSASAKTFALEADIMFQNAGQASLVFRLSKPSAGGPDNLTAYGVGLDTAANNLWAAVFANKWSPLGMEPMSLATSSWYHLRIDVRTGRFTVFLDGKFVMESSDSGLVDPGMIGLRGDWGPVGDAGTAPEVLFDNVKQSALED